MSSTGFLWTKVSCSRQAASGRIAGSGGHGSRPMPARRRVVRSAAGTTRGARGFAHETARRDVTGAKRTLRRAAYPAGRAAAAPKSRNLPLPGFAPKHRCATATIANLHPFDRPLSERIMPGRLPVSPAWRCFPDFSRPAKVPTSSTSRTALPGMPRRCPQALQPRLAGC